MKRLPDNSTESKAIAVAGLQRLLVPVAIARLCALAGGIRRSRSIMLPSPLFEDFCARLLDRRAPIEDTAAWLGSQVADPPRQSSVFRFAGVLYREYQRACSDYAAGRGNAPAQGPAVARPTNETVSEELAQARELRRRSHLLAERAEDAGRGKALCGFCGKPKPRRYLAEHLRRRHHDQLLVKGGAAGEPGVQAA